MAVASAWEARISARAEQFYGLITPDNLQCKLVWLRFQISWLPGVRQGFTVYNNAMTKHGTGVIAGLGVTYLLTGSAAWAGDSAALPAPAAQTGAKPGDKGDAKPDEAPFSPERPGFTNGTDTLAPHHIQLETGFLYQRTGDSRQVHYNDSAQVRVPLGVRSEVRLGLPVYFISRLGKTGGDNSGDGWGDSAVSFKYRFVDDAPRRPSVALIAGTTLPRTGGPNLRESNAQPQVDGEVNYNLSSLWQLQANAIYSRASSGGVRYNSWAGALNANYNITPAVAVFGETYRVSTSGSGGQSASYADTGATWTLWNNAQLDISGGVGISRGVTHDRFVGFGFTRRW